MKLTRKHQTRTRQHILADSSVSGYTIGSYGGHAWIELSNSENQFQLALTPDEARELATQLHRIAHAAEYQIDELTVITP